MRRLRYLFAILLFALSGVTSFVPVKAAGENLIQNPSVETEQAGSPSSWQANQWGSNTTDFSYETSGRTGSHSLKTTVSGRASGDAKWLTAPISVTPNTSYTYVDFYRANIDTEIDLMYVDNAGNVTYQYAQWMPAATDWTPITVTFTTPTDVVSVVPMHIIAKEGWLQTDDFSLSETVVVPPTGDNLVANPSMEVLNGGSPSGWLSNAWGQNTPTFIIDNDAENGARSLKTTISSYTSGDAKWYFEPVPVTAGTSYTYSDYYKSDVVTRAVGVYKDAGGVTSYVELGGAPISATWRHHTVHFTVPSSVTKAAVFHVLDTTGYLAIDNVELKVSLDPPHDHEDGENVIHNPSMETADGTTPASWSNSKWGNNGANFIYDTVGRTGNRSLKTTMSSYTSGDAKWFFEPETVTPGKSYIYRDYYKSDVPTRVVVAFQDASGAYIYAEQPTVVPSPTNWALYETYFTAPPGAVKTTVFHLIDRIGSLSIDDTLMQVAVPGGGGIGVPNGSLESGSATPDSWETSQWGTNTAAFTYVNEGRSGSKSVRTTVSNYQSGDAKWFFTPIDTLEAGVQYSFSAWYKGTSLPHVVAVYVKADGSEQYVGLPSPLDISATEWRNYTDTFTVPADAERVSVFMYVASNGWLQTDDYSIGAYVPNGFSRPLLTLTFDDGHEENYQTALPKLNQYGFKTTQCYATSFIEGQSQAVQNGVLAFHNSGHEICSHTVTHPMLTSLNATNLAYELSHSKQYLESLIGQPVRNFASPFGDYNPTVNDAIDNYYESHRTVDEGFNSRDNFDIYRIRVQNILDTTTAAQVQAWIEQAQRDKTWLVLVYHRVSNNPGPYDTYVNVFEQHLQAIANTGIDVRTYRQALDEIQPQL